MYPIVLSLTFPIVLSLMWSLFCGSLFSFPWTEVS